MGNILTVVNYMRQLSDKCISFVCESLFNAPDKSNQNYSFDEFDFYVKIPKRTDTYGILQVVEKHLLLLRQVRY